MYITIFTPSALQMVCTTTLVLHHCILTSSSALAANGGDPSGWNVPDWSLWADRETCSRIGVKKAILTMTAPGACIEKDPVRAADLARRGNEAGAEIHKSDPQHYGFFASLPSLLDTEACLKEIAYSLDTLNANGVILFTRYGEDNHYLGHSAFVPIWQELNRRKAVVFIHPTHAVDAHWVNESMPLPLYDYPHETGRAAMDLILSGTLKNHASECKIILSHAGGDLPYLVYRAAGMLPFTPAMAHVQQTTEQIIEQAKSFYFDVAISSNPITLTALLKFARKDHVLFGSDFPNAPKESIWYFTKQLEEFEMADDVRESIDHKAARQILPGLDH